MRNYNPKETAPKDRPFLAWTENDWQIMTYHESVGGYLDETFDCAIIFCWTELPHEPEL